MRSLPHVAARTSRCLLLALLVGLVAVPSSATASNGLQTILQEDRRVYGSGADVGRATLNEFKALGADIVKISVHWRGTAPEVRPSGFDGSNPAHYGNAWQPYDFAVREAHARGLRVFITLGGSRGAPPWATRDRQGGISWPNSAEFERFVRAVGTRYSGSYLGLPRVSMYSIWNEPNLWVFLRPQRGRGGLPLAPVIYRNLYFGAHRALTQTGHGNDTILLGELFPNNSSGRSFSPKDFLREMSCLDRWWRPYRGRARTYRGCPARAWPIPASGVAHHPYLAGSFDSNPRSSPVSRPPGRDNVPIGYLSRLTRVLDTLYAKRRVTRRWLPIYVTEYGFQTNPPDRYQFPIRLVPNYMDESEWYAYRNWRVPTYAHYTLADSPLGPPSMGVRRYGTLQMGLRFSNGSAKPGVYAAFQTPFFVRWQRRTGWVELFGGVRSAAPGSVVTLESRKRGRGPWWPVGNVTLNGAGYFHKWYRLSQADRRQYRLRIGSFVRYKWAVWRR